MRTLSKFILCIFACLLIGFIGTIFIQDSALVWYRMLHAPKGIPPMHILTHVWTAFYVILGICLWLGIHANVPKHALALFGLQLLLNLLWFFFFFGMQSLFLGLITMIFLLVAVWATISAFWKVSRSAATLLILYLVWVFYVAYLNFGLFLMNRPVDF